MAWGPGRTCGCGGYVASQKYTSTVTPVGLSSRAVEICMPAAAALNGALVVSGKASDIKCAIAGMKIKPEVVIFCCPRNSEGYISYDALEQVKDGMFFSGKYESEMVLFNNPHVIVFANFAPDLAKLSVDRWKIVNLNEENNDIF